MLCKKYYFGLRKFMFNYLPFLCKIYQKLLSENYFKVFY